MGVYFTCQVPSGILLRCPFRGKTHNNKFLFYVCCLYFVSKSLRDIERLFSFSRFCGTNWQWTQLCASEATSPPPTSSGEGRTSGTRVVSLFLRDTGGATTLQGTDRSRHLRLIDLSGTSFPEDLVCVWTSV